MRNKLFASAHGVISLSWYIAVLFLFVAVAANGMLSASTTPQISNLSPTSIGDPQLDKAAFAQKTRKIQIPFIANNGQVDERVKFYAKTFGGTVFVTKDGEIVYSLPKSDNSGDRSKNTDVRTQNPEDRSKIQDNRESCILDLASDTNGAPGIVHPASYIVDRDSKSEFQNPKSEITAIALREEFVGAKVKTIQGEDPSVTKVNYFKGNDPEKWKTDISTYDMVNLGEIYKGIELRLKAYGDNVEKLFCVKPGANPEQIKISLSGIQPPESPFIKGDGINNSSYKEGTAAKYPLENGARGLWVNEHGELVAETEMGPVKFTKPIAYQEVDGRRVNVDCKYVTREPVSVKNRTMRTSKWKTDNGNRNTENGSRDYGFTVASYDRTKDLIVDPLLASTFLGGSGEDVVEGSHSLALDTSGNVYVTGYTGSTNFPTTTGAYDASQNGSYDVFVSKLDGSLTSMLASTYLGGSNDDRGTFLALDISENVCLTGYTSSTNFPTTSGAYDIIFNSIFVPDVFVSKLNSSLTSLLASTYLGGSSDDRGNSLTLDASGNIYVTGNTSSSNFPTTTGAYDTSQNGSSTDVFVSKLNGSATSLLASTYLGGSTDDYGNSLALDASGNVYVTGKTLSTNFPTTTGAYDTSQNGSDDVFVSKLNVNGSATSLLASTYLGGSGTDYGNSLALDASGNVYVTGPTTSSNFPTTSGAYDTSQNSSSAADVFVSKLNGSVTALLASTYLGGSGTDGGRSLTLDASGNVYVTGLTTSSNFPTTTGAYDASQNGSSIDVFVSKLNGSVTTLLASTYLGGSSTDDGSSLTLDTSGNVYVAGYTYSADFPTTGVEYDTSYNGYQDAFISKFDSNLSASTATLTPTPSPTPTPTPTQECVQPPSDMVGWWPGDNNTNDISGLGNNGTLQGSATYGVGMVGNAFLVNASADFINVPNSSSLNFGTSTNFSIDAWIHTTQTTTATIIDKRTGTTNNPVGYHLFVFAGNLGFQLGDGSPFLNNNSPGPTINDGNWHYVAVTIDRTSTTGGSLYIDGALNLTFDPTTRPGNISNTADLRIGQRYLSPVQPFQGAIDEVEIFDRALTPTEIQVIYNAGSAGKCKTTGTCVTPPSNMVSWWTGDGNANDVQDGNNGTLINGATFAVGKVGEAFSLDGVDDYVSIPDDPSLDLVGIDFTIDFWLKTTDSAALYLKKYPGLVGQGWAIAQGGQYATTLGFWDGTDWRLSGVSVTTGNWVHIAVVGRISTYQLTWYINGVQGTTMSFTPIANTTAPLFFGVEVPGGSFHLNGLLDEVEIFNRALDPSEIQDIYNADSAGKCKPTPTPSPTATSSPTPTPTPTPTQACVQPPSDMVGWWPMDETQGSTAYDFAGTFQNNGTWKNNPVPVTGMVGGALSFDGSSYVEVGPAQAEINFQKNEDFSIDVWVKTTDSQSTRTLVDKRKQIGNGKLRGYHLYLYKGKPGLQLADGGSGSGYNNYNSTAPTAFVADGTWHHIAVTVERNNASGLNIYVDGANVASHNPTARAGNLTNKAPLVFGGKNLINSKFTFVGTLDELEIFNRALTQTEIQDIYNAGSAGKCKPTPTPSPTATSSPIPTLTISPVPTVIGTGTVFGWVEDADEEPLEGVMVAINEKGQLKQKSLTDEDGYYEFGGLPKGKYTITYEKEGYQTQTQDISLNEGEEKDLDITTMEQIETGEIFGNVVDIKGNPLESVSLELKGKKTKVKQTASSDEGGYFEFVDLEADTYNIVAKKPKYRKTQQKVKLGEGESKEIEIVMKRPGKTKYEP